MNIATGSLRSLPQQRSCRKHNPAQSRSPSQPGTAQRPRRSGLVARGGGAESNSAQGRPALTQGTAAAVATSQQAARVAVVHPGVRHGHAAVQRGPPRSPVNNNASLSHSPARQAGSSLARSHSSHSCSPSRSWRASADAATTQRAAAHRYRLPAATASTARRLSSSRACKYTVVEASDVVAEQGLHHVKIGSGPDPGGGRRVPEHAAEAPRNRSPWPAVQTTASQRGRSSARPEAHGRG